MKAENAIIAWTGRGDPNPDYPNKGVVNVFGSDENAKVHGHHHWIGAWQEEGKPSGDGLWRKGDSNQRIARMFRAFVQMVTRDGIDPALAHREFLKIDEYRRIVGGV